MKTQAEAMSWAKRLRQCGAKDRPKLARWLRTSPQNVDALLWAMAVLGDRATRCPEYMAMRRKMIELAKASIKARHPASFVDEERTDTELRPH
jgi:ferric-dicitrate binding protein FerR (iron transport regulator)